MDTGAHHVYMVKMLKKSMEVVVVGNAVYGIYYPDAVYVALYTWVNEKLYVYALAFKKIATIVLQQHFVHHAPFVKKHVN